MLEHTMVESGSRSFEMHEVQPRVLERVVELLYSGEVGEISGVAEGLALLEGSRFLRVERMEEQCSAWVCAHVEASNCVAVWAEASRLGCGVVAERALLVVGRRLAAVAGEAQFLGLSREALLELVRSEGLAVRSERVVYEAVLGWVRHDVGSRKAWLGEVLGAVRMGLLPLEYLAETVGIDPLVMESSEALRMFAEAVHYSRLKGAARAAAESDGRLRKRKHASGGELVVVGGKGNGASLRSVELHDTSAEQWRALPDMSVARVACAAVCIDGNVYVMGGHNGRSFLKSAEMYDPSAGQWRALPDMSEARYGCAAVCIDGNVYVMGGYDGGSYLKSAEMYDPSAGQWRALPDMSKARRGCAAVCIDGNVYVMGGTGGSSLKSAEMYDTSAGKWRALPDMSVERRGCAAVCIDGNVYVMGGYGGGSYLKSAEMYDPSAGKWRALPDMSEARHGCAAVCIDGNVYVVGGRSDAANTATTLASMECFDPITSEWHTLPSISKPRWYCAAVACDM
jgi:N-acetylneuraminic acid mutarotase